MPRPRPEASGNPAGTAPASPARDASRRAPLLEVFSSLQGEGLFVGQPQVFLRLAGCPLRCRWCDSAWSWGLETATGEGASGREIAPQSPTAEPGEPEWVTPLAAAALVREAGGEAGEQPRPLSITGGEPLIWPDFIEALLPLVGERPVHLETAGAHPAALARVVERLAHVSLDLKHPADLAPPSEEGLGTGSESPPGDAAAWCAARLACLELLRDRPACVKMPVAAGRRARDYEELLLDLELKAPELPLFIQPVTARGSGPERIPGPSPDLLWELAQRAEELGLAVRVVPQIHPVLGVN
ncbi:MAG: hypothetical protein CMK00_01720 [Planctomycetes bacterium]|nr:hypothetical protein [Planctomycetota bacterium]HJO27361.1 7-carboxy-7-deazaguanine synthase QueE [Planctomycetota bacterium]